MLSSAHSCEEALDAGRGVVRSLALVAVREEQDDRGPLTPFLLRAGDELVDDGLGPVVEVAELGLPEHQGVRPLDRVAVLEAHRGILREQGVVDPELALALTEVEQRGPLARVVLVDEHRVPLDEGATAAVLAGEPHGSAVDEQRPEGHAAPRCPSRSRPRGWTRARFSSICMSLGCTVKPSGTVEEGRRRAARALLG
jgi:hypothetical protein